MGDFDGITLIKKGHYRLQTNPKLEIKEDRSLELVNCLKDGLLVEKAFDDEHKNYYTICYIRYNQELERVELEDCEFRMLDIERQDWNIVKDMVKCAKDIVATQHLDSMGYY